MYTSLLFTARDSLQVKAVGEGEPSVDVRREIESPKLRVEYISKHKKQVGRPVEAHISMVSRSAETRGEDGAYEEIIAALRWIVGVDFTDYKRATI